MNEELKTWSPFQSKAVRAICAHMTDTERKEIVRRGRAYGVWCACTFAIPFGFAIAFWNLQTTLIAVPLILVHLAAIPFWQNKQKQFLCSTAWAQEQGFTPKQIQIFGSR